MSSARRDYEMILVSRMCLAKLRCKSSCRRDASEVMDTRLARFGHHRCCLVLNVALHTSLFFKEFTSCIDSDTARKSTRLSPNAPFRSRHLAFQEARAMVCDRAWPRARRFDSSSSL